MSRLKTFFKQYRWHVVLLRCVVLYPLMGMYYIGQAGERVGVWLSDALPNPRKGD